MSSLAVRGEADTDVLVIGGGHNGLVCASYLAKKGLKVTVLERRHVVGGAAVTEEIVPGFKFSRFMLNLVLSLIFRMHVFVFLGGLCTVISPLI